MATRNDWSLTSPDVCMSTVCITVLSEVSSAVREMRECTSMSSAATGDERRVPYRIQSLAPSHLAMTRSRDGGPRLS